MEGIGDDDDDDDDDDDYSGEVADEPIKCPDKNGMFEVIETLQRFSVYPYILISVNSNVR